MANSLISERLKVMQAAADERPNPAILAEPN